MTHDLHGGTDECRCDDPFGLYWCHVHEHLANFDRACEGRCYGTIVERPKVHCTLCGGVSRSALPQHPDPRICIENLRFNLERAKKDLEDEAHRKELILMDLEDLKSAVGRAHDDAKNAVLFHERYGKDLGDASTNGVLRLTNLGKLTMAKHFESILSAILSKVGP